MEIIDTKQENTTNEYTGKISSVSTYIDDQGRSVAAIRPLLQVVTDDLPPTKYMGSAVLNTPRGPMPIEFPITKEVDDVRECFKIFDQELKDFIQRKRDESRIVTPDSKGGLPPIQFPSKV